MRIDAVRTLPPEIACRVIAGQKAYEASQGVVCAYTPFALIARARSEAPIGVLSGYTAFTEVYVDDLWVAQEFRRQGVGRALLQSLESRYAGAGFVNINLVTNAFQAIPFYTKCGFEIEFTRRNPVEPTLSKTFFIKWLDR